MGAGNGRCSRCVPGAIRGTGGSLQKNKSPKDEVVDYKLISTCVASSTYAGSNVIASSYAGSTTEHGKFEKRIAGMSSMQTCNTDNSANGISSLMTSNLTENSNFGPGGMRTSDLTDSSNFGSSCLNMAVACDDKYVSSTVTDITKAWATSQSQFADTVLSTTEGAPLQLLRPKYWDASMECVHFEDIHVVVNGQATTLREYLQSIGKPVGATEDAYVRFQVVFLPSGTTEAQEYTIQTRSSRTKIDEQDTGDHDPRDTLLVFDSRELLLSSMDTHGTRSLPYPTTTGETGLVGFEGISDTGNVFMVVHVPAGPRYNASNGLHSRRIIVNITICESDDFGEAAAMDKLDELFDKSFILPGC